METAHLRACTNCVRAKARCSMTTSVDLGGKCDRCHRMNKLCQASPPVRRRRTLKRRSTYETSKLEEKLDGLVTLLTTATQGVPGIINPTLVNSPSGVPVLERHEKSSVLVASNGISNGEYTHSTPSPSTNASGLPESSYNTLPCSLSKPTPSSNHVLEPVLHPTLEPSPEDAESYLIKFRHDFVKHLPFIVIPTYMTAHQLRQDRPILWFSIMTVASTNSTQQISLSKELRGILAREVFVEGTRNMDLLLAILVYIIWDRRFYFGKPILVSLIQLAIAILYDLGLDKSPSKDPALVLAYEIKGVLKPTGFSRSPTMEERRALLGCFLMSSVPCKGTALRWTAYSNECLHMIEAEKEFESDALLVQLVKLRLIRERVNDLPWSSTAANMDATMIAPAMIYLKSLQTQLQDFKIKIPSELSNNETLLMELYSTELIIYEVGLSQAPDIFNDQPNRRIECLWLCVRAIKSWIGVFLGIKPSQYIGFSALIYCTIPHCFIAMYRLSTFEHSEWDRELFRDQIEVSSFLEESEKNFALVKEAAGLDIGGSDDLDSFTCMAARIRAVKMTWDPTNASTTSSAGVSSNDGLYDFPLEFSDEDWLRDLLGSWNE